MSDNELIAEFVDWMWDGREIKRKVDLLTACTDDGHVRYIWHPDTDIDIWHGDDGLLHKIEDSVLRNDFMSELIKQVGVFGCPKDITVWRVLQATPAQLTAALVAVIKEA